MWFIISLSGNVQLVLLIIVKLYNNTNKQAKQKQKNPLYLKDDMIFYQAVRRSNNMNILFPLLIIEIKHKYVQQYIYRLDY